LKNITEQGGIIMIEQKISDYIDKLNAEQKPSEHENPPDSAEFMKLSGTVRLVRTMKNPELPNADFPGRLASNVIMHASRREPKKAKKLWIAAIAAVLALAVALSLFVPLLTNTDIVYAMEKAFEQVKAYHGILEVAVLNENGEEFVQSKREVWADKKGRYLVKVLQGVNEGSVTANNGSIKWQTVPDEEMVYVFPSFPDPYRFTLELGYELDYVKNAAEVSVIGEEMIAGRPATVLEISPAGGQSYMIWVDHETKLPLQKQTAMHNALQYRITYTDIKFIDSIPDNIMEYKVPDGYSAAEINPEQTVNTIEEAETIAGFAPCIPAVPEGYELEKITVATGSKVIKLHYVSTDDHYRIIFLQGKAQDEFIPANTAILGMVGENKAEILSPVSESFGVLSAGLYSGMTDIKSIRWQENGYEYAVAGNTALDELVSFTAKLAGKAVNLPEENETTGFEPEIKVPVDIETEQNEQKSVDAGHSPWRLDPVYVAQVFVSLKISPEGITGDYPVDYEALKVIYNDGVKAVIEATGETPVRRVYLERLVRQDSTGIWTVTGYDPNE